MQAISKIFMKQYLADPNSVDARYGVQYFDALQRRLIRALK